MGNEHHRSHITYKKQTFVFRCVEIDVGLESIEKNINKWLRLWMYILRNKIYVIKCGFNGNYQRSLTFADQIKIEMTKLMLLLLCITAFELTFPFVNE